MVRTLVIAEAGVNHNGSLDTALALVDAAAESGADIVKFQTFDHKLLASDAADTAPYQQSTTGATSQADLLKPLELSHDDFATIAARCREKSIEFLSTAFDEPSLTFLLQLGIERVKIPSGDLTHGPALLHAARSGLPIIVSTGLATLDDVRCALNVIAFGAETPSGYPGLETIEGDFTADLRGRVSLLHCVTAYPAPIEITNLRAMDTLQNEFGLTVGLSDHSLGFTASVAAVARGAAIIEKHITLSKAQPGPDQAASLEPDEFAAMTAAIREVEAALGDGNKSPAQAEKANVGAARRSLVAARPIAAGDAFTEENVTVQRPGTGTSPMRYWSLLGTKATRGYKAGELINE